MMAAPAAAAVVQASAVAEVAAPKGLDITAVTPKLIELVKNVIADDDEDMSPDVPFMEAGVDSLGSVQLVTDIGREFQMPLAPSSVFDYPTVRTLAEYLVEESAAR